MTDTVAGLDAGALAERVADLARAVPGVVDLHGGMFGEVATYLPGRRLAGVRIGPDGCAVHVVVGYGHDIRRVAANVHHAVAPVTAVPITVTVEDVRADDAGSVPADEGNRP